MLLLGVRDVNSARHYSVRCVNTLSRANANPYKICFWLIAHIVYNPTLLQAIRREITPAISRQKVNIQHLANQCPLLDASFNEILRLTTNASSVRNVDATTTVGNKTLIAGAKLLIPYRQLHYNAEIFGPDVHTFNPSRFLDNKDLHKSPYFKPWGGGLTHCSGRFVARREVLALTAVILTQYELTVANKEVGLPKFDLTKPTLGVVDPIGGQDVLLELRPRTF